MKVVHDGARVFFYPRGATGGIRVQDGRIHGVSQTLTADQAIDLAACLLAAAALAEPERTWTNADGIPLPDSLFARLRVDTWRRLAGVPKSTISGLTSIVIDELNQRSAICHALNKALGTLSAALARGITHAGASDN